MQAKHQRNRSTTEYPLLKKIAEMAAISGLGENRLRQLVDNGEITYLQNGNRKLLTDEAIWEYYDRQKHIATPKSR